MNEIEKTIRVLSDMKLSFSQNYIQEAFDVSIEALREKAERNKGCYHCINSSKKIFAQKERYSNASETGIAYETIRVVFCPSCGKRLEVEHDRYV